MKKLLFPFIAALLLIGCKTNPPTTPQIPNPEYGRAFVTSNVDSALIIIDNISTGKYAPDTITATVGDHIIRLEKENYISQSMAIKIEKDSTKAAAFNLRLSLAKKIVLIEDFANVSCNPCVISNKILESVKSSYGTNKLLIIKYPTNFPSPNDPFFLANPTDCNARMGYYNILIAPTTKVDGKLTPTSSDSNSVSSKIDERLAQTPKFKITVNDSFGVGIYNIKIKVETIDTTGIDFSNLVLHTVVIESLVEYTSPPGSNGETKFHDVMRKMLPSNTGENLTYSLSGTQLFSRQVSLNPIWNTNKLETVAFIQNKITKEVLQAGSTITN